MDVRQADGSLLRKVLISEMELRYTKLSVKEILRSYGIDPDGIVAETYLPEDEAYLYVQRITEETEPVSQTD